MSLLYDEKKFQNNILLTIKCKLPIQIFYYYYYKYQVLIGYNNGLCFV